MDNKQARMISVGRLLAFLFTSFLGLLGTVYAEHDEVPLRSNENFVLTCIAEESLVPPNSKVRLSVTLLDSVGKPSERTAEYRWQVTSGRITSHASEASWDLTNSRPGQSYSAIVTASVSKNEQVSCKMQVFVALTASSDEIEDILRGDVESRWSFLLRNIQEQRGFGLYSYLIIRSHPSNHDRSRHLHIIAAYLRMGRLTEYLKQEFPPQQLNVTYVPVLSLPPKDIANIENLADWVLDNYDYDLASVLIKRIPGQFHDGPYIISSLRRLTDTAGDGGRIVQDLSHVPEDLADQWMKLFLVQASQEHSWGPSALKLMALRVRGELIRIGRGVEPVLSTVNEWKAIVLKWK